MRFALALVLTAAPALADAPVTSIRPVPRDPAPLVAQAPEPVIAETLAVTVATKSPTYVPLADRPQMPDLAIDLPLEPAPPVVAFLPLLPEHVARPDEEVAHPPYVEMPKPDLPAGVLASTAGLIPPEDAVRPRPRGAPEDPLAGLRPRPRSDEPRRPSNPASDVEVVQVASAAAVLRSPRPEPRPENLVRRSVVAAAAIVPIQPQPPVTGSRRGSVCGDRSIRGEEIAPIPARVAGCGLPDGVRVTEVDGVRLSTPANIDCVTAQALRRWVTESVKPTVGRLGGGVAGLQVMASYNCRTRNNQPGAKVSEHGRGHAIDIGAIILRNGQSITVLRGWRDAQQGAILRALHQGACAIFGTVLGPNSDRFHQNHFHLDTARYRSGHYCR